MKKILIAFLLIISNAGYSADIIVKKILFNGLKRISPDTILCNLPIKIGLHINEENISDSIKTLFATGYFEEITISKEIEDDGVLLIQVKERPIINNININGNKLIKNDVIKNILNSKKIKIGEPFNEHSIFEVKQELEKFYHHFGKFLSVIKIENKPISNNRVDLYIILTEGKTATVKQINIFGNHVFNKKQLLSQFTLYKQTKWWHFPYKKQYKKQKFFQDLDELRNFYLNRGYAKFHIDEIQIDLTPDKKNVCLSIYITEGTTHTLDSIVLKGNITNLFPNIKQHINIAPNELYSNNKIKEIEYNIRHILNTHGYVKPNVSIKSDISKNKTVKLYIYVDTGYPFYVREIKLAGNYFTKDEVIRREIHQNEQTLLNYIHTIQDQNRLKKLRYLKTVNAYITPVPNTLNQIDIVYEIDEHNTGNINLSLGIGTESGLNAQFGMYQNNILGSGNTISINGTKNYYQTYAEISALKPYYGINNINIGGKIFYYDLNRNNTNWSDYNLKNYGININYAYPITEYNKFNIGLNYIYNYLNKISPQIVVWRYLKSTGIHFKTSSNYNDIYPEKTINFLANDILLLSGWTYDNLNHAYFPTSGSEITISNILTLPKSDNKYYKIIINNHNYIPLDQHQNWILKKSIYAGYAGSINKKESPFYDNFYAGGIETIRGFKLNSIGPKAAYYRCNNSNDDYNQCSIKNSQDTIGGNAIALIQTELIVPLKFLNKQYSDLARISLFLDAGTVWDTLWKNTEATKSAGIEDYSNAKNIRISGGISLKWISPIGPVIFSYSKLIKKHSGDIEEPFQFSIGKIW